MTFQVYNLANEGLYKTDSFDSILPAMRQRITLGIGDERMFKITVNGKHCCYLCI